MHEVVSSLNKSIQDSIALSLDPVNLLVGEAIGRAILFRNVEQQQLNCATILLQSKHLEQSCAIPPAVVTNYAAETVLCVAVCDVNADGCNEILIGTNTRSLYLFRVKDQKSGNDFVLYDRINFPSPIFAVQMVDINADGLPELLVSSMYSLNVLQVCVCLFEVRES